MLTKIVYFFGTLIELWAINWQGKSIISTEIKSFHVSSYRRKKKLNFFMCLNTFMKLHTIPRICIQYCLNSFYRKCSVNYSHALFYNVECKLKYLQILLFNANLPVKRLVLCYFQLEWILVAKTHYKNSSTFDKLSFAFSNDTAKNHFFCCWNFQTKLVTFFFFSSSKHKIKLNTKYHQTNWVDERNWSFKLVRSNECVDRFAEIHFTASKSLNHLWMKKKKKIQCYC